MLRYSKEKEKEDEVTGADNIIDKAGCLPRIYQRVTTCERVWGFYSHLTGQDEAINQNGAEVSIGRTFFTTFALAF
jgi:hypothetical protein